MWPPRLSETATLCNAKKFVGSRHFTRGPYGERGKGRAFFMMDPDGNESEINTRYLYGTPTRE